MTVGSLFSGIGGLELGLEMCGVGPVLWQAECDPYALAVLEHHWPTVHRYTDVRQIDGTAARVDVVCGGFPCQPHSAAGARLGTADPRWIWPEFARIVGALRPQFVFIENVPQLRESGLRVVLADLAALGFDAEWGCFTAAEVGAPHARSRLFILAYANAELGKTRMVVHGKHETAVLRGREDARPGLWATPTPEACRGDDGLRGRMDIALLGNSAVPQQAALAWKTLMARTQSEAA
jgi:DNA (cytosine-5)-methyltransferase 1